MLRPATTIAKRHLFKNLKKVPRFREEKDTKHHEYSIRPDTFAFRIGPHRKNHPLQKSAVSAGNVVEFVYKNATNYPFENNSPQDVFDRYPETNSAKLARLKHRPRKVKMLALDFIEDSLYNPQYGYFSKEVEIFHRDKPFNYNELADVDAFMEEWQQAYRQYDQPGAKLRDGGPATTSGLFDESKQSRRPSGETHNLVHKTAELYKTGKPHKAARPTKATAYVMGEELAPVALATKIASGGKLARHAREIQRQDLALPQLRTPKSLQLWHTPTELFSPYYGEALARYIVVNYKLNGQYPYHDLIIYEMGGGNGTLMVNVLDYIRRHEPDIYTRTHYKIIEISSQLAQKQYALALHSKLVQKGLDSRKLEIVNKSIFAWDTVVENHCFFIALEVFDNFAHDVVRYDLETGVPHQGYVVVDDDGDMYEFFSPDLSHYTSAFLGLRENGRFPVLPQENTLMGKCKRFASLAPFVSTDAIHPLLHLPTKLRWKNRFVPLKDNLTPGEFVPTRLLQFFQILKHRFPNHLLISSDFHSLPNTMKGYYNAPVVQTMVKDRMVDVSTYMCHQGYFDIMFPTDFALASDMYRQVTGKLAKVEMHREFLEQWADVDATTTRKGENPMLDFYRNVSFMVS